MAGFNKIAKWVKAGMLIIVHIYAKVFIPNPKIESANMALAIAITVLVKN
ncbi:hypothetical protein SPBRAN_698 [uncultured Candidatus Thioglobus sp.]|nr:hypothetical protein SPBRAN_698 [uncultured Candidatus Thioglobus sp.]